MDLPVIDLDVFLSGTRNSDAVIQECQKVRIIRSDWVHPCHSHRSRVTRLQMH
jgi:hypothetical protein